ncbi:hypothetical protein TEA_003289 [Camellia sinensis var. sinensis]|uniref:Uncharacterized protein n=1 Tax=Camellia sinensis var. sinensis TaxID=542762 RepID=A0A4S4DN44_CAMSN|nr:hypothetical protein TEA_003289 [Camellia sinensis var. sinensis]
MASITMKKVERIRQIVKLKLVMKRWKSISLKRSGKLLSSSSNNNNDNGVFLDSYNGTSTSTDTAVSSTHQNHIPLGFLAVYVGSERERFLIPTRFLNLPIFKCLLEKAEEEYGFNFTGGIALPCKVAFFRIVLKHLEKDEHKFGGLKLDEFLKMRSKVVSTSTTTTSTSTSFDCSCSKQVNNSSPCHSFTPVLQKSRV